MRQTVGRLRFLFISCLLRALLFFSVVHAADPIDSQSEGWRPARRGEAQAADPIDNGATSADDPSYRPDGEINLVEEIRPWGPVIPLAPPAPRPPAAAEPLLAGPGTITVSGLESRTRPSTDIGSLLGKSQSGTGVEVQKRTPIVTDPRPRGTHVGELLAIGSGSFWIPARQDLDTLLSKIDSSLINEIMVVKGPYSVRYGPGFSFTDFQLLGAPRYPNGLEWHGASSLNYQTNGQQWSGRQTLLGGASDWGIRVGYGHRTGNDYESGDGTDIESSYNSRIFDTTFGFDLSPDSHLEVSYLRLDQTDVEFPGEIFDIDFLVTDGYELKYVLENQPYFDRLTVDTWYNRTRFEGNAQRPGKRRQIPQLDDPLDFLGFTNVDSMSTGYRLATTWGQAGDAQLTFGADLRYVEQELNEIDTFTILIGVPPSSFRRPPENFPIPRSHSSNPGLFLEQVLPFDERFIFKGGARVDWVATNIEGTPPGRTRAELQEILGTKDFDQEFALWSAYITGEFKMNSHLTALAGFGHAERPPTLTELYAAQPFLAILQQGFTSVVGDPELDTERLWQMDLSLRANYEHFRGGIHGFYAWIHDYITYEAPMRHSDCHSTCRTHWASGSRTPSWRRCRGERSIANTICTIG